METQNVLSQKYVPINGLFYEKLESAATQNVRCELVFVDEEGNEHNVISRIEDLYTDHGAEYAVLEDHKTVRLDQIKSINGEVEPITHKYKKHEEDEFTKKYYSSSGIFTIASNNFYELTIDRKRNLLELTSYKQWESMEEIPDLKSQLIKISDYIEGKFGLLNNLSHLQPNEEGVLEAPFLPARGILINAGLSKVGDLLPESCNTVVHNRGSFSVNSLRVRSFKQRFAAENWLTEW